MTEQPPSAAMELLSVILPSCGRAGICRLPPCACAESIDALIAQRVSAETERWQNHDRQRLEQIARLQETAQSLQSASAESPAPEPTCEGGVPLGTMGATCPKCGATDIDICGYMGEAAERPALEPVHLTLREQGVMTRALLRSTRPAPERPQPDVWTEEDIRAGQAKADELVKAFEQQDSLRGMGWQPLVPSGLASTGDFARCLRCVSHELTRDVCGYAGRCVRQATGDAPVAQMAEAQGLNPGQCQFESDPAHQPPTRVVDYTERAREIWDEVYDNANHIVSCGKTTKSFETTLGEIAVSMFADALSAIACERDAALHAAPPPSAVDYTEHAAAVHCKWFDDRGLIGATSIAPHQTLSIIPYIARALSAVASEREAARRVAPSPGVVDYTERALTVARDAIEGVPSHLLPYRINSEEIAQAIAPDIADALSERDAAALRAFGKRVWSDTEEVAYQAGVSDTLERLK